MSDAVESEADTALPIALAALSLCETIMVVLCERGLVSREDMEDAMRAAIDSHLRAEPTRLTAEDHRKASNVIQVVMNNANAIRASAHL